MFDGTGTARRSRPRAASAGATPTRTVAAATRAAHPAKGAWAPPGPAELLLIRGSAPNTTDFRRPPADILRPAPARSLRGGRRLGRGPFCHARPRASRFPSSEEPGVV